MKIIAFVSAIVLGGVAFSQSEKRIIPDSLKLEVSALSSDSAKATTYNKATWDVRFSDPELAVEYSLEAIRIAKHGYLPKIEVDALTDLGYTYEVMGEANNALIYHTKGYEIAIQISYVKGAIDGANGSGSAYWMLGKFAEAIDMFQKTIQLAKNNDMIPWMADAYNNLGNVYLDQNRFDLALENYQKAASLLPDENRTKAIAITNIGLVHLEIENSDKSLQYFKQGIMLGEKQNNLSLKSFNHKMLGLAYRNQKDFQRAVSEFNISISGYKQLNNEREVTQVKVNLGSVLFDQNKFQEALDVYLECIADANKTEDLITKCHAIQGAANSYLRLQEFNKAEKLLDQLIQLSTESKNSSFLKEAYFLLSELYAVKKQYSKAFENQTNYLFLKDSLFNEEKSKQIAEMETRFESVQKEREIELLNAQNEISTLRLHQRESQRNILIVIASSFLLLGLVLFNRYKLQSKSNKKLQELDKLKSRFFTNISHEFRTPLTLILGPIENKLSKNPSDPEKEQLLLMKKNANRLLELINQLLELSKLEAGQLKLHLETNDFNFFMKTLTASFESLAIQKKIKFTHNISDKEFKMPFDQDKCHKIFYNLLSNAIKFSPANSEILVSILNQDNEVMVSIKDSGIGIPQHELENIFKRFHQLNDTNQTQGTGVGLSLAHELVALHRGKINVSSEPHKGTTFSVSLPNSPNAYSTNDFLEAPQIHRQHKLAHDDVSKAIETSTIMNREYILVVEDNQDVRKYISSILTDSYNVELAENGKEGLDLAIEQVPDLIISDLMMPEMDGNELCHALKTNEKTSHIPLIMLTAKADSESKIEGLKKGADDYLIKPFNEEELKVRVKNLIDQRKKLREKYAESSTSTFEISPVIITPPDKIFMEKVLKLIENNISNYDFSAEIFQKEMAMSRMQLHRKLKALTNCSATEFVRKQRLRHASDYLKVSGISVSEAAYRSGFNNLSYFAKCFKEEFGVSPSEYFDKIIT
jgi:signal transduction histidine kinase/DNA-binding response OmpR family regulator/Tfp pilus assembly protein PilF